MDTLKPPSANKIAGALFAAGSTADTVFATAQQGTNSNQVIADGLSKEIQKIQGFRTDITPANEARLAAIKTEIEKIDGNTTPQDADLQERTAARRLELNTEAFKILGKTYVDIDGTPELKAVKDKIDDLLEPPLRGDKKDRLIRLRKLEKTAFQSFFANPESLTAATQLRSVSIQIAQLVPPRLVTELTLSERREYDALAAEGNQLAGTEAFLPAAKKLKIEKLQRTIGRLNS